MGYLLNRNSFLTCFIRVHLGTGLLFSGLFSLLPGSALASDEDSGEARTVLDSGPWLSARAAGMGGALSTLADGIHAPFYNPAGIGGIHWEKSRPPLVRQLHFPYVAVAANEATASLHEEFSAKGGSGDKGVGGAILDANAGERQFGRASALVSLGISRFVLVQYQDAQMAAIRKETGPDDPTPVSLSYQSQTGSGAGFSVTDPNETLYLGAFSSFVQRSQVTGDYHYNDLVQADERRANLQPNMHKYTGVATNIGMIWTLGKFGRPAVALVNKNAGGTRFSMTSDKTGVDPTLHRVVEKENLTMGFSLSPHIGKSGAFNFIIEGQHLTDKDVALNKKFRTAMEMNLGGFGSEGLVGLRAGYNLAGASFGLNLNLGLVQFEAASHAEDIGTGNRHVVERRNVGVFSVNVLYE